MRPHRRKRTDGSGAGRHDRVPTVRARISEDRIEPAGLLTDLGTTADGASILFVGRVRDENSGRPVARLHYEAYREMAEQVLEEILLEAVDRWEVGGIAAAHRTGVLSPGEASVAIAVTAPHRAATYAASRYVIEEIKTRLPVWKLEEYEDGSGGWLAGERVRADGSPGARRDEGSG